jgi:antitoxin Phd
METHVKSWPVQDAKARFSELLETCLKEGPQIVTKRGVDAAVLMPVGDWRRLQRSARPTLKELLLTAAPRGELHLPKRGGLRQRSHTELA